MDPVHIPTVLVAFFAIMNPIANAPVFVGLTTGLPAQTRRRIAYHGVLLAFAIVSVFSLCGGLIFKGFGITLPAFRIAGGILVTLVGFNLLHGESSSVHTPSEEDNEESKDAVLGISVSPLAMPLLAGPGTIATAMSYAANQTYANILKVIIAFAVICFITLMAFLGGQWLVRVLGQNAIKVMSRLMGLILAVVGVQMLIDGIQGAFDLPK